LLLLISSGNLYGIGVALGFPNSVLKPVFDKWGTMAMLFLACGQILYLIFFFAWLFEWIVSFRVTQFKPPPSAGASSSRVLRLWQPAASE
jgi:hypothetical protein